MTIKSANHNRTLDPITDIFDTISKGTLATITYDETQWLREEWEKIISQVIWKDRRRKNKKAKS